MNPETRKKATIWLLLVFVLGLATGAVFGYSFAHHSSASMVTPAPTDAEKRARRVAELKEEVGLTAEQAQKMDALIAKTQREMHALQDKNEEEVTTLRLKSRDEARSFLTPEQKPKFEELMKRIDEQRRKEKETKQQK